VSLLGYSTGAIALGDFARAIALLAEYNFQAIELSALRCSEVAPLIAAIPQLELSSYKYVSFHAPSSFSEKEEESLIELLASLPESWPIVLHPDAVHDFSLWTRLAPRLAIENMDRRKGTGRTVSELYEFFDKLPEARMCLDLGHARQVDSSMVGAYQLLKAFSSRIVQLHVSEVDTFNRHDVISRAAELAFAQIRTFVPSSAVIILESRVESWQIQSEAQKVRDILDTKPRAKGSSIRFNHVEAF
jgi:hypothetical protein